MEKAGFLVPATWQHTFDALRANDLIFSYVVNNWLLGNKPPAFDLLVWNKDSTRMPARMHSQYRQVLLPPQRIRGGRFEWTGSDSIPPRSTSTPTCWPRLTIHRPVVSGYKTTAVRRCQPVVLSTSGHIAGIVNPLAPRPSTGPTTPPGRSSGVEGQRTLQTGTWWEDWTKWIAKQGGPKSQLQRVGNKD